MSDLPLHLRARLTRVLGPGVMVTTGGSGKDWNVLPSVEPTAPGSRHLAPEALKKMKAELRKERTARTRKRNKALKSVGIEPSDFMRLVKNNHLASREEFDTIMAQYLALDVEHRAEFAKGKGVDNTASPANTPKPTTKKEGVSMPDITIEDLATVVKDLSARLTKLESAPAPAAAHNDNATPRVKSQALVEFATANPGLIGDDAPEVDGFVGTTDVFVYDVTQRSDTYTDRDTGLEGFWVESKKGKKFLVDITGVPFFLHNPIRDKAYADASSGV